MTCMAFTTEMFADLLWAVMGTLAVYLVFVDLFVRPFFERFVYPVIDAFAERQAARLVERIKGRK